MDELFTNAELLDDLLVTVQVFPLEIIQQFPTLADHPEQAAPGMMIVLVTLEMIRERIDLAAE
jgi:hypothetical protein